MEDEQLVALFWKRSQEALTATLACYGRYLAAIAGRILQRREDAEECVNDTLLRAWNAIPPQRPEKLRLFLGKITRNLALDRLDTEKTLKRGASAAMLALDELEEVLTDGDAETLTDSIVLKDALNRFLQALPEESRLIFLRRYWYFYSIREIAQGMSLGESKVKMKLFRIRKQLKLFLEQEGIIV